MRFFSRKKTQTPSPQSKEKDLTSAIVSQKNAIDLLEKRHSHLEIKIKNEEEQAKAYLLKGDKRGAMFALQRKKMLLEQIEKVQNSRITLESQIMTLEAAQSTHVAVNALKHGVAVQKDVNAMMDINGIDKLVSDLQDQKDLQNEISHVLESGSPIFDEDELSKELELLESREIDSSALDRMNHVPSNVLPEIPAATAPPYIQPDSRVGISSSSQKSDDQQLRELMGEFA